MSRELKLLMTFMTAVLLVALFVYTAAASSAPDVMRIGVGARPLGMGKAYVAVAEDADTIFMNPAGLAGIDSVKLTSMYTSLMGDVNYLVIGGAYPMADGAVGAGIISTGVSGIPLYSATGVSSGTANWQNSIMFLSYGTDISKRYYLPIHGQLQAGANLKFFNAGGSGSSTVEGAAGSGMDIDLGLLYLPDNYQWLKVGANAQNILPASMGGKYTSGYGIEESIPANLKAGVKVTLMGKEKAITTADHKVDLAIDVDMPVMEKVPGTAHYGVEYWPNNNLALRVGMDSNASGSGGYSNLTAGLGVRVNGMEFNYAYHPYDGVAENTTHFFSVGFVGVGEQEPEISVMTPTDKTVVYANSIKVEGTAVSSINRVVVNGIETDVKDNKFSMNLPLDALGKKVITVQGFRKSGKPVEANLRVLRLASYADVGQNYWAKSPIETSGTIGLVQGYPDGSFKPNRALTRAELATLIVRAKGIPLSNVSASTGLYKDLNGTHWAAKYIKAAKDAGYVKGYPDGTFKPNKKISKAEGIAVVARVDGLGKDIVAADLAAMPYTDVPKNHWAANTIAAANKAGLLDYVKSPSLGLNNNLSRAEAVEVMSKTSFANAEIQKLLSWFVGFRKEVTSPVEFGPSGSTGPLSEANFYRAAR